MKAIPILCSLFLVSRACLAFTPVQFDASKGTPESQGWEKTGGIATKIEKKNNRSFIDVLDDSPGDCAFFVKKLEPRTAQQAVKNGFVFEVTACVKKVEVGQPGSQRAGVGTIDLRAVINLFFNNEDQVGQLIIADAEKPIAAAASGTGFNTWKIVYKPTSKTYGYFTYYLDGKVIEKQVPPLPGGPSEISFGSIGGGLIERVGHVQYEKVVFRPLKSGEE